MAALNISDSELKVMQILWREGRPLSFAEIRGALEENTKWSKSTIQTLVTRLRGKGAVKAENAHITLYTPVVSESEYIKSEGQNFLDKLFGGSARNLVAAMYQNGQLQEDDINELRAFFAEADL